MRHVPLLLLTLAGTVFGLTLDRDNIGISRMIPKEGEQVVWQVPVANDAEEAFAGDVTVTMRSSRRGERLGKPMSVTKTVKLAPRQNEDFAFSWTPPRNGYFRVLFKLQGTGQSVVRDVAVTKDDVYFVWFGAPKEFKWCNVPTTVKREDEAWWLRRGAIPAQWKGGVCYKEWSVQKFVESWGASDWIAIDEVGGPGEVTDKFIAAWKRLKRQKPDQWIAVWYMGAHQYWKDVADLVDLFVPEIYLNYRGNHLGQFDAYFRVAREAGVMAQVIPGLGINQIKDKQKRVTNSPTKADVLRQFQYVKRTAPELRGIGFFTAYSAAPGVAEYADALCEQYYIKPVLTLQNLGDPIAVSGKPTDEKRTASVKVGNVGGMDAEDVLVEWRWGDQGAKPKRETVSEWPVGEAKTFHCELSCSVGWAPLEFRIVPRAGYTVLDGIARECVIRPPQGFAQAGSVVIPAGAPGPATAARFASVDSPGPFQATELVGGIARPLDVPCASLPARPGTQEQLVVFPCASRADRTRVILLKPGGGTVAGAPSYSREGSVLSVTTEYYRAKLDLATDQLVSLGPRGGLENIFKGAWHLRAAGHEGFQQAKVRELPGALVVTIPYDSEKAAGESQYVFLDYSPAIRVARSWRPKGEVALKGAGDRCGLFQQGGSFALQAGVGGPVRRGALQDGRKYRDLLFGYLGERPRPENADKAGWIDFSYGADEFDGGLGVVIDYRWQDSDTKSYDVTRLYDASDWLEVLYLWGKEKTFVRPQKSCVYLIPHRRLDFTDESILPPAQALWNQVHARQLALVGLSGSRVPRAPG